MCLTNQPTSQLTNHSLYACFGPMCLIQGPRSHLFLVCLFRGTISHVFNLSNNQSSNQSFRFRIGRPCTIVFKTINIYLLLLSLVLFYIIIIKSFSLYGFFLSYPSFSLLLLLFVLPIHIINVFSFNFIKLLLMISLFFRQVRNSRDLVRHHQHHR